ncbi:hypothetical protein BN946_scf185007.g138 [Trametes cinnabarina]|uniref:Carboxylic ester hydrolase n=1 Tax=Pycnoporus cinnabarinus TaxID=5643 RepID=A0A060SLH8_PYCCI|nr:hypothetical protein BN946_scf185007.g138 [Trametes cinnabarina]
MARLAYALCLFLSLLSSAFAASDAPSPSLVVRTTSGIFKGQSTGNGTDRWLGIPFAEPPVGSLRFKAPVAITKASSNVKNAFTFGNACPQAPSDSLGAPISEDCLFLNARRTSYRCPNFKFTFSTQVFRPSGINSAQNLPVLVWFYGGAFMNGAASDPEFNPTSDIHWHSNYRVNTFGFLASRHVPPEDLNAGLHDQQMALAFLQENVAAFGGDPEKVTIWGQSAGAGSVEAHILFPPSKPSFRAAILDSSTGPFKTAPPASRYDDPGFPYALLLEKTGCPEGPESFVCLQRVPFELNEGTIFSQAVRNLSVPSAQENAAFDTFIKELLIDPSTVTQDVFDTINKLFPANDSSLGGPFNTGDSLFDRAEAWYTDNMYLGPRRLFFDKAASTQPLYAYHFREFIPGQDPTLGVFHASELILLFGAFPAVEQQFAEQMADFYINFINDLDPGAPWPRFTPNSKNELQLMRDNITVIPDDFDLAKTTFLESTRVLAEFQK